MRLASSEYFLNNGVFHIGNITSGAVVPVEFIPTEKMDLDNIEHIKPGCGCTADIKVEDGIIKAIYTDQSSVSEDKEKGAAFTKTIYLYMKDGKPLTTINSLGNPVFNDDKEHIILYFSGTAYHTNSPIVNPNSKTAETT